MRRLSLLLQPIYLLPLLLLPRTSLADPVNVTIDDQFGDPTNGQHISYVPPFGAWERGQTCTNCTAKLSPASGAYLGTWTDATFNPSGGVTNSDPGQIIQASVSFVGTAVYVVCILTGSNTTTPNGNTDMTFKIDNVTAGVFQKQPNGNATYLFNQTVFAQTGLSNTLHTITLESGHAGQQALVLLDAIIYTADNSSSISSRITPSSSQSGSSMNIGVIVGPVVAAVVVVLSVSVALFFFLRFLRKRRHNKRVRISIDGLAVGEFYAPRPYSTCSSGSESHGPDMRNGVQHVSSDALISAYTVGPSVINYGCPTSSFTGPNTDPSTRAGTGSGTAVSLSETIVLKNIAPSEMDGTVFSEVSSPPACGGIEHPGAASHPYNARSLPLIPQPNRKS